MEIAERLASFARDLDGQPVVWGSTDCTATPALWLKRLGWAFDLPVYGSRDEAHAIIARHGDLVSTWMHYLDPAGISPRYDEPQIGDVAVIDTRLYRQIGGIVASGSILLVRKDNGNFQWFGPVRRFAAVWAAT